jgi:hypothetical protein
MYVFIHICIYTYICVYAVIVDKEANKFMDLMDAKIQKAFNNALDQQQHGRPKYSLLSKFKNFLIKEDPSFHEVFICECRYRYAFIYIQIYVYRYIFIYKFIYIG